MSPQERIIAETVKHLLFAASLDRYLMQLNKGKVHALSASGHGLASFEIATKIAYQNGALRGTPKGKRRDCREVTHAAVLPTGYAVIAKKIADRRMILAGYRLADLVQQISANSAP